MWLSRDKTRKKDYALWDFEPKRDDEGDYWISGELASYTSERFCQLFTGVRLRPSQCVEIKEIRFVPKTPKDLRPQLRKR